MTTDRRYQIRPRLTHVLPLLIGALLVLVTLTLPAGAQSVPAERRVTVIPVEGMACVACAAAVRSTVKSLDGVLNVEVSLVKRTAKMTYQTSKLSAEQIAAAIAKLGYKVGTPRDIE